MLKKIDNFLFQKVEKLVVVWVRRKKFKEHKYDFFLNFQSYETAYWLMVVMYDYYQAHIRHSIAGYILTSILLIIVVAGEYFNYRTLLMQKNWYDTIFAQRKNPVVYTIVKEVCEETRVRNWDTRKITLSLQLFVGLLLIVINPKLAPIYVFMITRLYSSYIFDFDEPDRFEKAKKDLTEIEEMSFKNLIKNLAPTKV